MMRAYQNQRGSSLMVSLIMLVVLTLLVTAAMRSSNTNLRIAGNMQAQAETQAAVQKVIENVISSDFTAAPAASTTSVDVNNDGVDDYTVSVAAPTCTTTATVRNDDLSDTSTCWTDGYDSLCSREQWDVQATVSDSSNSHTAAQMVVHQGVIRYIWTSQGHAACVH
jgi:Tfp pilus assembly protein PilX